MYVTKAFSHTVFLLCSQAGVIRRARLAKEVSSEVAQTEQTGNASAGLGSNGLRNQITKHENTFEKTCNKIIVTLPGITLVHC